MGFEGVSNWSETDSAGGFAIDVAIPRRVATVLGRSTEPLCYVTTGIARDSVYPVVPLRTGARINRMGELVFRY
jgi:hypothetical protein